MSKIHQRRLVRSRRGRRVHRSLLETLEPRMLLAGDRGESTPSPFPFASTGVVQSAVLPPSMNDLVVGGLGLAAQMLEVSQDLQRPARRDATQIVFVDEGIEGYQVLVDAIRSRVQGARMEVIRPLLIMSLKCSY